METPIQAEPPLVSVVIPTHNRIGYLKQSLASALCQTYRNLEVIVSDDCSVVDSRAVVESFGDPRVRFHRNATNLGMFGNIVVGYRLARGQLLAPLNDDDLWEPSYLERMVRPLEADPELALSFCDYEVIDANGQIEPGGHDREQGWPARSRLQEGVYRPFAELALVDQAVFTASAAVFRLQWVQCGSMPEGAGVYHDVYSTYLACRGGRGAYYVSDRLASYRVHAASESGISGTRDANAKVRKGQAGTFCNETFMRDEALRAFHHIFKRRWSEWATTLGIGLMRLGRHAEARPYLLRAFWRHPNARTLAALSLNIVPHRLARPFLNPWRNRDEIPAPAKMSPGREPQASSAIHSDGADDAARTA